MAPERSGNRRRDRERAERLLEDATDDGDLDVSKLLAHLDSDDPDRRASTTWALVEAAREWPHRTSRAADDLVETLGDDDQWVRRGASWALSRIATAEPGAARGGVEALTGRLADDDPLVRENASQAIATISEGYPSRARPAVPALAERLEDDDPLVRRYAEEALRNVIDSEEVDTETLDPPTIHRLSEFELRIETDVPESGDDAPVEQVEDEEPSSSGGPPAGGAATRVEAAEEPRPPETVPDAPTVDVESSNVERVGGIGTGRTGVVHRARVRTGADDHVVVALKQLRRDEFVEDAAGFDEAFDRVSTEWRRLGDHDYVISLLGADRVPEPWLAMEYMDAGSLRNRIGWIGFAQATWTAICVVRAVSHAHAHGVIHGGIRPSNVLFSQTLEGTWDVPKVTDWGLLRCFFEHSPSRRWLDPTYATPEQLAPDRFGQHDHATDVYQLGTLTYELFAGRPPFEGTPAEVARKVVGEEPRPTTDVASDLPADLDDILTRALAKRKPERYETVDDLRRELEVFAAEHAPDVLE